MKTCNRKILELFYNANHSGRISKPDAIGRVGEDSDGLVIEITWRVIDGIIEDAKFRAFGNPNAIAITSLMTDYIIGKSVDDAMLIGEDVIVEALDEFRPEYMEAFDMVRAAMDEAYGNYLKRQSRKDEVVTKEVTTETNIIQAKTSEVEIEPVEQDFEYGEEEIEFGEQDSEYSIENTLVKQTTTEIQVSTITNIVDEEKRGRGRPRKIVDTSEVVEVGEKRGRGRPRKERPEGEEIEVGEKRGRGRPRKERPEGEELVVGEKRGRGRPRKIVDETEIVDVGEKRGRGRPRKERPEGEELVVGEKRGRGRPRKIVDESEIVEVGEKRGRGRPRKIVDESEIVEVGEKRGRGRPKKEVKYNLPTDLDEVTNDKELDELIHGNSHQEQEQPETAEFVDNLITNKLIDEDDDMFDADYDLFKSNIRNILSGKEVNSSSRYGETRTVAHQTTESVATSTIKQEEIEDTAAEHTQATEVNSTATIEETSEKRGRGRPRKIVDESEVVEVGEKRGRGRPRKEIVETEEVEAGEKRGRGRPRKIVIETVETTSEPVRRVDTVNSLTRSLSSPGGMPSFGGNQNIVFASKNVTTTNINVSKTSTTIDNAQGITNTYSQNVNYSKIEHISTNALPESDEADEIDIEPVEASTIKSYNMFRNSDEELDDKLAAEEDDNFEDDVEDFVDDSHIKDEAPKGGIEDLLKALLDD